MGRASTPIEFLDRTGDRRRATYAGTVGRQNVI
jgi:hypothetical protein